MKDIAGAEALRKTKKYAKKTFQDEEDIEMLKRLMPTLQDKRLKAVLEMYDRFLTPYSDQLPKAGSAPNLLGTVQAALDDLYMVAHDNDSAGELCDLLSGHPFRGFVEAFDTIGRLEFEPPLPEFPSPQLQGGAGGSMVTPDSPGLGRYIGGNDPTMGHHGSTGGSLGGGIDSFDQPSDLHSGFQAGGPPGRHPMEGAMKMVGIRKEPGEQLGITVTRHDFFSEEHGPWTDISVERIMAGSQIEQEGILHPGDIIREVNGVPVDSPEALQKLLRQAVGIITLKVIPAYKEKTNNTQLFLRAFYSYNPDFDGLIPCKEAGLHFNTGDVLQILNQEDEHWWQARKYGSDGRAGLIPSVTLQERRKAFIQSAPDPDEVTYKMFGCGIGKRKKKQKMIFRAREAEEYEATDVVVYEEVARIPGFQRQVICFLGAPGVGRRTIRHQLQKANSERYGVALPHTSRPMRPGERSGDRYFSANRSEMEADIARNRYIEVGELNGHFYGTKLDTIRAVCKEGKTCLLDCGESALKSLRTSEFMPYVVFIASPTVDCMKAMYEYGRSMGFTEKFKRDEDFRNSMDESVNMERKYRHLFDYVIVNDNMEVTLSVLRQQMDDLLTVHQWVPAKWLY